MKTQFIMRKIFESIKGERFKVVFWDGEEKSYGQIGEEGSAAFTLRFHQPPLLPTGDLMLYFGEAYMNGVFDIDGDWDTLFDLVEHNSTVLMNSVVGKVASVIKQTLEFTKKQQKDNVASHYDLGNDFYRLWLDTNMLYSCAFFHEPSNSLEQAQENKLALCLDKLDMQPGMKLLDIGCGWGQLAIAAAKRGATVLGITLSKEQAALGVQKVAELGLQSQVEIRLMDYMDLNGSDVFDRVVSVGMYEHVGEAFHETFFKQAARSLNDGGLMLLHTVTRHHYGQTNAWTKKYIFPGGHIPTVSSIVQHMPTQHLDLMHVDSLRLHYAYTLEHWLQRFDAAKEKVLQMFDERFIRMWRLYLKGSAASFRGADLDIHQFLMSKRAKKTLPVHMGGAYPATRPVPTWNGRINHAASDML